MAGPNLVTSNLDSILASASRAGSDNDDILNKTRVLSDMVQSSQSLTGATKVALNNKIISLQEATTRFHTNADGRVQSVRQSAEQSAAVADEGASACNTLDVTLV